MVASFRPVRKDLTFEEIKEKLACQAAGKEWVDPRLSEPDKPLVQISHKTHNAPIPEAQDPIGYDKRTRDRRMREHKELKETLTQLFKRHGVEPADELIKIAQEVDAEGNFTCPRKERIQIWIELLSYQLPKLRAVEVAGTVDHEFHIHITKFADVQQIPTTIEAEVSRITFGENELPNKPEKE